MHILKPQFAMAESHALAFAAARGFGLVVAADAEDGLALARQMRALRPHLTYDAPP